MPYFFEKLLLWKLQFDEENVWKLCDHVRRHQPWELSRYYAVFISNAAKMDYHVICLHRPEVDDPQVYDLDTLLTFPSRAEDYVEETMKSDALLRAKYHRKFRVIPAELFLKTFASDRSHMKTSEGEWMQTPPHYPCIATQDSAMNLEDFISMQPTAGVGQVVDLATFKEQFT